MDIGSGGRDVSDRVVLAADAGETVDRLVDALAAVSIRAIRTESVRETLLEFDSDSVAAVLATASLPDGDGLELLERVRAESPGIMTILLVEPGETAPLNTALGVGVDRTLVLDPDGIPAVAELVRGALDSRDLADDRRRERALSGAFLAGISALTATTDPQSALEILPERLVSSGAVSVAWVSQYDPESETFEPDSAAGIDRGSLRSIPADELALDSDDEGPVRTDPDDPNRVTLILRSDDVVFGGVHLYLEPPAPAGPEQRLLAAAGRALGRVLAGDRVRPDADTSAMGAPTTGAVETRSTATSGPEPEPTERNAVEVYGEVIAHELRNHLDVAQSYLRLGADVDGNEDLERVDAALTRIESVIEEAEAVAGHTVRDAEKMPVDIGAAAERVWNRIEDQTATLDLADPGTVRAHPGMLDLLLENLFRNAVTHAGPDVTVEIGDLENGFYVEDDGPGIPSTDRESVFDWGFTGRSTKDGVGLAIVRRIAEAHGWAVTLTESESGGARFEFAFEGNQA